LDKNVRVGDFRGQKYRYRIGKPGNHVSSFALLIFKISFVSEKREKI
jgi:hypothetical protein